MGKCDTTKLYVAGAVVSCWVTNAAWDATYEALCCAWQDSLHVSTHMQPSDCAAACGTAVQCTLSLLAAPVLAALWTSL